MRRRVCLYIVGDCKYDEKWYKSGETFVSMDCKSNCTCQADGSTTCRMLCPPPIAPTACGEDEMLVLKPREMSQSPRCFCEHGTCMKRGQFLHRRGIISIFQISGIYTEQLLSNHDYIVVTVIAVSV